MSIFPKARETACRERK